MTRKSVARKLIAVTLVVALAGCRSGVLDPHGPVGHAERTILIDALAIMLAIVVPTIVAALIVAWWYRSSNPRARYLPKWSFHGGIELVVWGVPFMVIILLAGVTWIGAHEFDPAKPLTSHAPTLQIEVVSIDWKWLFVYPQQQIASVNEVIIPAGAPGADLAPGEARGRRSVAAQVRSYLIGFVLAVCLTVLSFYIARTSLVWAPSIPIALSVLALAQMGVHLVFFLHITSGPDNINNSLALAFGLLIVMLLVFGSLWIMTHLSHQTIPTDQVLRMQH